VLGRVLLALAGGFYPSELPRASWFPRYVKALQTVELNAPFLLVADGGNGPVDG